MISIQSHNDHNSRSYQFLKKQKLLDDLREAEKMNMGILNSENDLNIFLKMYGYKDALLTDKGWNDVKKNNPGFLGIFNKTLWFHYYYIPTEFTYGEDTYSIEYDPSGRIDPSGIKIGKSYYREFDETSGKTVLKIGFFFSNDPTKLVKGEVTQLEKKWFYTKDKDTNYGGGSKKKRRKTTHRRKKIMRKTRKLYSRK
jgi:hypothetical protein